MHRHYKQELAAHFKQCADFSKNAKKFFLNPLKSPLEEWGVFFKQPKCRVNHSLSAQKLPFGFGQTSGFLEKQKKLFLNPSKSPFRRIEGLFQSGKRMGLLLPAKSLIHLPKTALCLYSKRWFFRCTQNFLVHCAFWTAKEVEGFLVWPIEIFKIRFSTLHPNG